MASETTLKSVEARLILANTHHENISNAVNGDLPTLPKGRHYATPPTIADGQDHRLTLTADGSLRVGSSEILIERLPTDYGKAQVLYGTTAWTAIKADSTGTFSVDTNKREGIAYTNTIAGNKMNLYFFDGTQETILVGDLKSLFFEAYIDNFQNSVNNLLFLAVYTKPTGIGDAQPWYHSRRTYSFDLSSGNGNEIGIGEKSCFWALENPTKQNFAISSRPIELSQINTDGDFLSDEEILYIALNSDSAATQESVSCVISNMGFSTSVGNYRNLSIISESAGAATEAKQDDAITKLTEIDTAIDSIDGKITACDTGAVVVTSAGLGWDGSANQKIKVDSNGELQVDVLTLPALSSATDSIAAVQSGSWTVDCTSSTLATEATVSSIDGKLDISNAEDIAVGDAINTMMYAMHTSTHITDRGALKIDGGHNLLVTDGNALTELQSLSGCVDGTELQVDVVSQPALASGTDSVDAVQSGLWSVSISNMSDVHDGLTKDSGSALYNASITSGATTSHVIDIKYYPEIDFVAKFNAVSSAKLAVSFSHDNSLFLLSDEVSPWKVTGSDSYYYASYKSQFRYIKVEFTADATATFQLIESKKV